MRRMALAAKGSGCGRLRRSPLVASGDRKEHVLERVVLRHGLERAYGLPVESGGEALRFRVGVRVDDHMETLAEERYAPGLHLALENAERALRVPGANLEHATPLGLLDAARRAFGHELPGHHEAQAVALLGFFEVVRGPQDRRPSIGETVDAPPEGPPCA